MKIYNYIKLVIFVAFAVLVVVFRDSLLINLKYLVSSLLLAFGVESIITIGVTLKKNCYKEYRFFYGFVEIVLGLITITSLNHLKDVCIVWAIWSISRESFELFEIFNDKIKGVMKIVSFIESIIAIVFSILLMISPTEKEAKHHIYLLIVEFIVTAFSPVLSEINFKVPKFRRKKKEEKNEEQPE